MEATKSRKSAEHQARRRFILDATRNLLATTDIESVGMEELALAAGYTRRTLYAYFKSRDDILLQLLTEDLIHRWGIQKKALSPAKSGLENLMVWARVLHDYSQANPQTLRLQRYWDFRGIDQGKLGPDVFSQFEQINNELAEGLREIFSAGVSDGSMRTDLKIDFCISQFLGSYRAALYRVLFPSYSFASFDADEYIQHYLDLFSRAIRQTGGTEQ